MSKTKAQQKAEERARMRGAGFVIYQSWVHREDRERLARFAERLLRSRKHTQ